MSSSRNTNGKQGSSTSEIDPTYARYLLWLINGGTPGGPEEPNEVTFTHRVGRRVEEELENPIPIGEEFSPEFVRELEEVVREEDEADRRKKRRSKVDAKTSVKSHKKPDDDVGPSGSTRSRMQLRSCKPSKR